MPRPDHHGSISIARIMILGLLFSARLLPECAAQSRPDLYVSGHVIDAESQEPLVAVNVFIAGTTIGGSTNSDGYYSFQIPFIRPQYELVASMVGFQVSKKEVTSNDIETADQDFTLRPVSIALGVVEVTASNQEWKNHLERFRQIIFSTTRNGDRSELVNPEVLDFEFDQNTGVLTAQASGPLRIRNHALGYEIVLHDARLTGSSNAYEWQAVLQFSEIESDSKRQTRKWDKARTRAYEGSPQHFLASVAAGRSRREGFQSFEVGQPGMSGFAVPVVPEDLVSENRLAPDSSRTWTMKFDATLMVEYGREQLPKEYERFVGLKGLQWITSQQQSWIVLPRDSIHFDAFGNIFSNDDLNRYGYWAWERLGETLPADYKPE